MRPDCGKVPFEDEGAVEMTEGLEGVGEAVTRNLFVGRGQDNAKWWYPLTWIAFPLAYLVYFLSTGLYESLYSFLDPDGDDVAAGRGLGTEPFDVGLAERALPGERLALDGPGAVAVRRPAGRRRQREREPLDVVPVRPRTGQARARSPVRTSPRMSVWISLVPS